MELEGKSVGREADSVPNLPAVLGSSKVDGCPGDFVDCGSCLCVPEQICDFCPRLVQIGEESGGFGSLALLCFAWFHFALFCCIGLF